MATSAPDVRANYLSEPGATRPPAAAPISDVELQCGAGPGGALSYHWLMCGRYTLRRINLVRSALDAAPEAKFEEFTERPRFNVAPSQDVPVVRLNKDG